MSHTFSIACLVTKQRLWIGQGWSGMTAFYSGDPTTMQLLGKFLRDTQGYPLVVCSNDELIDYEEYTAERQTT